MRKIYYIISFLISNTILVAQARYYKTDPSIHGTFSLIEKTNEGGWTIATSNNSNNSSDIIRYDRCGNLLWSKTIFPFSAGEINACMNGDLLVSGRFDAVISRLDQNGNVLFCKKYDAGAYRYFVYSSGEFKNGDLFLTGVAEIQVNGPYYSFVIKTDSQGQVKWSKGFTNISSWGFGIPCEDGGILTRHANVSIKTDSTGNVQWAKSFDFSYSYKPLETNDGFVFARYGEISGNDTGYVYKTDKQGNLLWSGSRFPVNYLSSISRLPNGHFRVLGSLKLGNTWNFRPTMIETDSSGLFIKQIVYNPYQTPASYYSGYDAIILKDTSVVFTGCKGSVFGGGQIYYAKTSRDGTLGCGDSIITTFIPPKALNAVNYPLSGGNLTFNTSITNFNISPLTVNETQICSSYDSLHFKLPQNLCLVPGDTIVLSAPPGYSYLWSNGDTLQELSIFQPGLYILKMTDPCGGNVVKTSAQVVACNSVNTEETELNASLQLFPNPSTGIFTITANSKYNCTICIYDVLGNCVRSKTELKNDQQIDLRDQPKGIYFVELVSDHQKTVKKISLL